MRLFVDANILISGIVFNGNEHHLLTEAATKKIQLITSEDVLGEVTTVLNRKFPEFSELVKEFLKLIKIQVIPRRDYRKHIRGDVVRDPSDAHVLAAALTSESSVIVTGDSDLLAIGGYHGIDIKTSRQILTKFKVKNSTGL